MKAQEALNRILWEIRTFIKNIIQESVPKPDVYNMRIEGSDGFIKILIHNSESNQIVGKAYPAKEFIEFCIKKQIEFKLNNDIRQMLVLSEEKTNRKVRWI